MGEHEFVISFFFRFLFLAQSQGVKLLEIVGVGEVGRVAGFLILGEG